MIVRREFLDHWKTQDLINRLNDPLAPLYLIRLWGHCEASKKCRFPALTPSAIKAICRFPGTAEQLDDALREAGFLRRDNEGVYVVNWDEHNAGLVTSWENGKRGGRPKSKPASAEVDRVAAFDKFWDLFPDSPKKTRRDHCLHLWETIVRDDEIGQIFKDMEMYLTEGGWSIDSGDDEYMPDPAGYLAQRTWK
jgi:hypothetical protein